MSDKVPFPSVKTVVKVGNFTLNVYAYRLLTKTESKLALKMYMKKRHLNRLPASGSAEIVTLFGSDSSDIL